ncbi:MarR family transcriptional regulator [Sphingobacterium alkalisoli]|uniref:MarR family transcriptional regulator n=1 Tax=Sphingobacterium alkalisoli TaxID=1874115 RepID=A0A4U0H6H8_9SPHI|nr:MarR family transcriptional regulator [Sphingobacterium alkalisoli]TJY66894.1 MarR family transcriptional regulator [Sphingobacterium alkalisoli]GGH13549.1 transcriptional regulator [Sphingobacterium alkalisoli]
MLKEKYNQYSFILDRTARRVKQFAQTAFAQNNFDLTVDQWTAMRIIHENSAMTNKELAELCGKDQPTFTRIIDLLIKKGLAERAVHPSDRRCLTLRITENGVTKINQIAPKVAEFRMQAWQNLSEEDFKDFVRILDTIYTNLTIKDE